MIKKSIFKDGANKNLTHPANKQGITLIALVVTIMFFYDKLKKCSNNNSFLLYSI